MLLPKVLQEFLISLCVLHTRPCYQNFCRLHRSCWIVKVINLRIMLCSSAFRCSSSLLQIKRRLRTILPKAPNLCFSFKMEDNISYPYNRKLKILCVKLYVWSQRREDPQKEFLDFHILLLFL